MNELPDGTTVVVIVIGSERAPSSVTIRWQQRRWPS